MKTIEKRNLSRMPKLAVIYGPNGSGKTRLLRRIASISSKGCVINIGSIPNGRFGREERQLSNIDIIMKSLPKLLESVGNTTVLLDETGMLNRRQIGTLYSKLREMYKLNKISGAYITRTARMFSIRSLMHGQFAGKIG